MVITGLTRNQFAGNRTWVRIPPSPPIIRPTLFRVGVMIHERDSNDNNATRMSVASDGLTELNNNLCFKSKDANESHRLRQ